MNISFLGAAREVSGSCYFIETADAAPAFADTLRARRGWDVTVPAPATRVQWEGQA